MQILRSQLQSDHLQYGFKRNSSCSQAIYTLRTVVERHIKSGSTVTLCALDISKAFDRVDHFALLQLLLDRLRHLTNNFVAIFYNWFLKCNIYVRSATALLYPFTVRAGVRQEATVTRAVCCIC